MWFVFGVHCVFKGFVNVCGLTGRKRYKALFSSILLSECVSLSCYIFIPLYGLKASLF